jgi:RNA polymerase primary sigma factor
VRLPLYKIGDINKIRKAAIHLEPVHERVPSAADIGLEVDMSISNVKQALKNSSRSLSMDAPFQEGENENNLYDIMSSGESPNPDKGLMQDSLRIEIGRALDTLSPRESDVVRLSFGLSGQPAMSLQEIGDTFDLSRERVRQIREKAIRRLRQQSKSHILKNYLG